MSARLSVRTGVWIKAVLALECIWVLAGGAIFALRSLRPTVPEVVAFIRQHDVKKLSREDRTRVTREVAQRLNQLDFAQLEQVRFSQALAYFYQPLTPSEKERWAEIIVPITIHRLLAASRSRPLERRMDFITESIFNQELDWLLTKPVIDSKAYGRIRQDAIRSYLDGLPVGDRQQMEQLWEKYRQKGRGPDSP